MNARNQAEMLTWLAGLALAFLGGLFVIAGLRYINVFMVVGGAVACGLGLIVLMDTPPEDGRQQKGEWPYE